MQRIARRTDAAAAQLIIGLARAVPRIHPDLSVPTLATCAAHEGHEDRQGFGIHRPDFILPPVPEEPVQPGLFLRADALTRRVEQGGDPVTGMGVEKRNGDHTVEARRCRCKRFLRGPVLREGLGCALRPIERDHRPRRPPDERAAGADDQPGPCGRGKPRGCGKRGKGLPAGEDHVRHALPVMVLSCWQPRNIWTERFRGRV